MIKTCVIIMFDMWFLGEGLCISGFLSSRTGGACRFLHPLLKKCNP